MSISVHLGPLNMTYPVWRIKDGEEYSIHLDSKMWLDLNGQDYTLVDTDSPTVDICSAPPKLGSHKNSKIVLKFDIWHTFENQVVDVAKKLNHRPNLVSICKAFDPTVDNPNIIYNDFMFNRTKAYYTQFPFSVKTRKWYYYGQYSFVAPPLKNANFKQKIFVAPNKTYTNIDPGTGDHLRYYRQKIVNNLYPNRHLGYIGNMDGTGQILYPNSQFPMCDSITELEAITEPLANMGVWPFSIQSLGYNPPHNEYYKNTFISIYGETIEYGTSLCATEKTYDPLIKGHFVLPFSCAGFIKFLKTKGFVFPDFIDYSYDLESDDEIRYKKYIEEANRLLSLDIDTWRKHWDDNLNLIRHNQLIFHERPYDRVDLHQVVEKFGK